MQLDSKAAEISYMMNPFLLTLPETNSKACWKDNNVVELVAMN